LLTIDTDDLNYVQDPSALAFIEGQVRTALGLGAYQQALPQLEPVGPSRTEPLLASPPDVASGWDVIGEFLAANEAIGRVGVALAGSATGWSEGLMAEVRAALQDAMGRLRSLADAIGVDLGEAGG
jgi:hypothetical protein